MKTGDKIRIIRMDDSNGKDFQARQMSGRIVTVKFMTVLVRFTWRSLGWLLSLVWMSMRKSDVCCFVVLE